MRWWLAVVLAVLSLPAAASAGTVFLLDGRGWGHGVGLCQIGAAVMADRGYAHTEILSHYFPGARLQTLY